ncbi:microfibrillar-associated protein 2-like [Myxocyprinus asiaticus]|uniref:microfibrillar-associated protein 2-like n=1 Tax=Myxocyprinus asiaticus TaxID=70543 RepID=UPI002221972B|nr:microfibrillar-associated protein 2-like [Myxocyprinus asiaticus]XP_051551266.1 microfibrillar-associated protein 2-like [Myxocyprinus asiaticus]
MKLSYLILLSVPALILAQNYDEDFLDSYGNSNNYEQQYYYQPVSQQILQAQTSGAEQSVVEIQTEPTEPGPLECREEQYPCTRLYSVHQPCKQCLNSICFYSLRRVYVINKEICVRTVCAHEELLRADMCRDQFSRCGVVALSGQCGAMSSSCAKSCGSC